MLRIGRDLQLSASLSTVLRPPHKSSLRAIRTAAGWMVTALGAAGLLTSPGWAQSDSLPPNTIDCRAFDKLSDGNWRVGEPTTFDFGTTKGTILAHQTIRPQGFNLGDMDLFAVIEKKCGRARR